MEKITNRQLEIIEASAKILTSYGINGLTIKNIAKKMNFSEAAIYRHFSNKEEIILTLLNFVIENITSLSMAKINENYTAIEKLKIIFEEQFIFFNKNPHLVIVIFSDSLLEESKEINEKIFNLMKTRKQTLEPVILQGQNEGIFTKDLNSDEIIHIIMGSVRLQMYKWRINKFNFDIIKNGNKIIENLIKVISNK
ncbi:MAG: TetR/AcrR family transcriptional regulator [Candidatus Sericytochromatia bacterium]